MPYSYEYPRPALAVDCVVFAVRDGQLQVLLIRRANQPYAGRWALPGGFVEMDETIDQAAARELLEETGLSAAHLEQLYTFGEVRRDPRERVVSVAYYALVPPSAVNGGSDAVEARWFVVDSAKRLAFDHDKILRCALERLRNKIRYEPVGFGLLPEVFTLSELQRLYEAILGQPLDKRNFRKVIKRMDVLREAPPDNGRPGRPAKRYRFDRKKYQRLVNAGFDFAV